MEKRASESNANTKIIEASGPPGWTADSSREFVQADGTAGAAATGILPMLGDGFHGCSAGLTCASQIPFRFAELLRPAWDEGTDFTNHLPVAIFEEEAVVEVVCFFASPSSIDARAHDWDIRLPEQPGYLKSVTDRPQVRCVFPNLGNLGNLADNSHTESK